MKFAYADPPYLGCGSKHYAKEHAEAAFCDSPSWHEALIRKLVEEHPDGWALSASSPSLITILPMCPLDVRVMAWVKPFASFKPNVGVAYTWEPVIVRGGRKRTRDQPTIKDHVSASITLERGLTGVKPWQFCTWIFDVLNVRPGDELVDMFPGSGAVSGALKEWLRIVEAHPQQFALEALR